jgi:hypothetical protein
VTRVRALLLAAILAGACGNGDIRGSASSSADGRTYLAIDDDNGGHCGGLIVDGHEWPHELHAPGAVEPGLHRIACGDTMNSLGVTVKAGTTYHFNYWGP